MKNTAKKIFTTLMAVILLFLNCTSLVTSASAVVDTETGISPYLTNCYECAFTFSAAYEGQAQVAVSYVAKSEVFTQAKLTVKIQKRFLGLFWTTVDIGEPNNEWIAYCYDVYGDFYNSFPLESTGTYRAVFTVEFSGTTGEVDVIEDTIESKYN